MKRSGFETWHGRPISVAAFLAQQSFIDPGNEAVRSLSHQLILAGYD
jgi:hypothetical protein